MYRGKYMQHDNNRDGIGQYLELTQNITRTLLAWHPTALHDQHETQSYLYLSTGTGPYNNSLDPIQMMADYGLASGVITEHPEQLAARGTILRGMLTDRKSPITYGYDGKDLPIYFNQDTPFTTGTETLRLPSVAEARRHLGVLDAPLGKGHIVLFALRPFWQWQTQELVSWGSTPF
jgi:hypothetical protein